MSSVFPLLKGIFHSYTKLQYITRILPSFQWQSWRSYGYHLTPGFSVINQSGIVVLYLGGTPLNSHALRPGDVKTQSVATRVPCRE